MLRNTSPKAIQFLEAELSQTIICQDVQFEVETPKITVHYIPQKQYNQHNLCSQTNVQAESTQNISNNCSRSLKNSWNPNNTCLSKQTNLTNNFKKNAPPKLSKQAQLQQLIKKVGDIKNLIGERYLNKQSNGKMLNPNNKTDQQHKDRDKDRKYSILSAGSAYKQQNYNQLPQKCYTPQRVSTLRNSDHKYSETASTVSSQIFTDRLRLADFDIMKKIGKGKFGEVFQARHKNTGMVLALKKIPKANFRADSNLKQQLINQIKIQSYIQHVNLVKLYTFFNDDVNIYLVMQLVLTGNLYQLTKKSALKEGQAMTISRQICQGLEHLHQKQIIHRDLKLQNILHHMGIVKICDFGCSVSSQVLRETICGTPLYFSPQILQQQGYDTKVDIWSLGIITYQLLNGKAPFNIKQHKDLLKIINDQLIFDHNNKFSQQFKQFVTACLDKNPNMRPSAEQLLQYAFLQNEKNQIGELF